VDIITLTDRSKNATILTSEGAALS